MRCFVALWPDAAAAEQLAAVGAELCRHDAAARRLTAADLHLTLAFIGELFEATARALADALAVEFDRSSRWSIDHVGAFPRARVLWGGGADDPALGALAEDVRDCLGRFGAPFDTKAFVPHITLARGFRAAEPLPRPLATAIPCRFGPPRLARSISTNTARRYATVSPNGPVR